MAALGLVAAAMGMTSPPPKTSASACAPSRLTGKSDQVSSQDEGDEEEEVPVGVPGIGLALIPLDVAIAMKKADAADASARAAASMSPATSARASVLDESTTTEAPRMSAAAAVLELAAQTGMADATSSVDASAPTSGETKTNETQSVAAREAHPRMVDADVANAAREIKQAVAAQGGTIRWEDASTHVSPSVGRASASDAKASDDAKASIGKARSGASLGRGEEASTKLDARVSKASASAGNAAGPAVSAEMGASTATSKTTTTTATATPTATATATATPTATPTATTGGEVADVPFDAPGAAGEKVGAEAASAHLSDVRNPAKRAAMTEPVWAPGQLAHDPRTVNAVKEAAATEASRPSFAREGAEMRQAHAEVAVSRMTLRQGIRADAWIPEMGRVGVETRVDHEGLSMRVAADHAETAALVAANKPELRADLEKAGVSLRDLSLGGGGVGSGSGGSASRDADRSARASRGTHDGDAAIGESTSAEPVVAARAGRVRIVL